MSVGEDPEVCPECGREAYGADCSCGFDLSSVNPLPRRSQFGPPRDAVIGAAGSEAARHRALIVVAALMVLGIAVAIMIITLALDGRTGTGA